MKKIIPYVNIKDHRVVVIGVSGDKTRIILKDIFDQFCNGLPGNTHTHTKVTYNHIYIMTNTRRLYQSHERIFSALYNRTYPTTFNHFIIVIKINLD